jgi:hypothetical protein
MPVGGIRRGAMRRHSAQLRQECRGPSGIRQRGKRAQHILLSNRESSADCVRVNAYAFEFLEQLCEPFGL